MKYFIYLRFLLTIIFTIIFPLVLTSPGAQRWKLMKGRSSFNDFVEINGTDFYLSSREISFDGAEVLCRDHYMQLLTLTSRNKTDTIFTWLNERPDFSSLVFWTGGWRAKNSSAWFWGPWGMPVEAGPTFWLPEEPRDEPDRASRLLLRGADRGWWADGARTAASVFCEPSAE